MNALPEHTVADDKAERLFWLFAGSDIKHGTYTTALRLVGEKMEMQDESGKGPGDRRGPATVELWQRHLDGSQPLGVHPLRADGMCRWGAIDLDGKDVDGGYGAINLAALFDAVEREKLPLVVCRSKSGGAHLYLFVSDWTEQANVGSALKAMAARLGLAGVDVFPPVEGVKNWVNMPYIGGDDTDRYCVKKGGLEMTLAEFIRWAESRMVHPDQLADFARPAARQRTKVPADHSAGPKRAERDLARYSVEITAQGKGNRSKLLYGRAKDLGKMVAAGWIDRDKVEFELLKAASSDSIEPLTYSVAKGHIKNGIDDGVEEPATDDADADRKPKIDLLIVWTGGSDIVWELHLAGWPPVKMTVKEAMNYRHFNTRCAEAGIGPFRPVKEGEWNDLLADARRGAEEREIPKDETVEHQFREMLCDFLFNRNNSDNMEDALHDRAVLDADNDRVYFKVLSLKVHASKTGGDFRHSSLQQLGAMLNAIGGSGDQGKTTKKIKGKTIELRWMRISMLDRQTEPLSVPPVPGEPI